jgi:septal ring factor EnvC (AmiA/AmiB activator)
MCRVRFNFILLLLLLNVSYCWAAPQDSSSQLKNIRERIDNAQTDLDVKKKSELQLSRELTLLKRTLQNLDKQIAKLIKEQRQIQSKSEKQKKLVKLGKKEIKRIGKQLEKRLVALYKEGEIGPLKILFTADSPTELVQQYHYLSRVVEHDRELLAEYRGAVDLYQQEAAELERLNQQKTALLEREMRQRKDAAAGRRLQSRLLKQVKSDQKRLNQELVQLKEKAQRLQGLMTKIRKKKVTAPSSSGSVATTFGSGKGKLSWPVKGDVLIGFGTQQDKSLGTYYESNGIEILVAPGTVIKAVADGNVVYSDWFKGYGNLLILNHAGGFHTLYAQAAELEKSLGDQVRAGEVIGKSGLGGRDSIYFEIRSKGTPIDPLHWLRRR